MPSPIPAQESRCRFFQRPRYAGSVEYGNRIDAVFLLGGIVNSAAVVFTLVWINRMRIINDFPHIFVKYVSSIGGDNSNERAALVEFLENKGNQDGLVAKLRDLTPYVSSSILDEVVRAIEEIDMTKLATQWTNLMKTKGGWTIACWVMFFFVAVVMLINGALYLSNKLKSVGQAEQAMRDRKQKTRAHLLLGVSIGSGVLATFGGAALVVSNASRNYYDWGVVSSAVNALGCVTILGCLLIPGCRSVCNEPNEDNFQPLIA